jgi:hypothetical protein
MRTRAIVFLALTLTCACGKKEGAPSGAAPSASNASNASGESSAPVPASATTSTAAATASAIGGAGASEAGDLFTGKYEAKIGVVRTPDDAPKFDDTKDGALGPGSLELSLPASDGEVQGKASGALGDQTFEGALEDGKLRGVLRPTSGANPSMTGVVDATVTGTGAARSIAGTLRAASEDGRVVREATFSLAKGKP